MKKLVLSGLFLLLLSVAVTAVLMYVESLTSWDQILDDPYSPWSNINYLMDGDWSTYATGVSASRVQFLMTYSKPTDSLGAIWMVKDGIGIANLTIPSSCWNTYSDKIVLEVVEDISGPSQKNHNSEWWCYDNLGEWNMLRYNTRVDDDTPRMIYEEGVFFIFDTVEEICIDIDGDGYGAFGLNDGCRHFKGDCDDTNADVSPVAPEICDGLDNNCDGSVDENCHVAQCSDGLDNDGDGLIDWNDPGCYSKKQAKNESTGYRHYNPKDNREENVLPQCMDNFDNDYDGLLDYPADPDCINRQDDNEAYTGNVTETYSQISNVTVFN